MVDAKWRSYGVRIVFSLVQETSSPVRRNSLPSNGLHRRKCPVHKATLIGTPKLFWVFQSNVATIHTLSERRLEH